MIWVRLESGVSRASRRQLEQQRQQRAVRRSQQQRSDQCQQQHWFPVCEGDSRRRTGNRPTSDRAECASPRTSAASRTKAHQTQPVSRGASPGNEYESGAGVGSVWFGRRESPRACRLHVASLMSTP